MHYSVLELSLLQLLTSGSYGFSVFGLGDIVVVFWGGKVVFSEMIFACFLLF